MPLHVTWSDIAIRVICTLAAGLLIGLNRGEHGRPAGLRTTMLVALAACVAMIQANVLVSMTGSTPDSFVKLDPMRLPLGILSGIGFIGAGAIIRRENLVLGVTTAATIWMMTVIGLSFGGGQIALGAVATLAGAIILMGLKALERHMRQERIAEFKLVSTISGPGEDELRASLQAEGITVISWAVTYAPSEESRELGCHVMFRARATDTNVPDLVQRFAQHPGVLKVQWLPV
jgi:putative Mg2+ transporter-C (MgtC) family protein